MAERNAYPWQTFTNMYKLVIQELFQILRLASLILGIFLFKNWMQMRRSAMKNKIFEGRVLLGLQDILCSFRLLFLLSFLHRFFLFEEKQLFSMFPANCIESDFSGADCIGVHALRLRRLDLAQWVIVLLGAPRSSLSDEPGVLNELIGSIQWTNVAVSKFLNVQLILKRWLF